MTSIYSKWHKPKEKSVMFQLFLWRIAYWGVV